tara:strand:+ start:451 stop:642 length:192 start_codon:yes stop_codon:yes gene_type:complete
MEVAGRFFAHEPPFLGKEQAEIVMYDPTTYHVYIANTYDRMVQEVDFSHPSEPQLVRILVTGV